MTAGRDFRIKIYDHTFKKYLKRKCSKVVFIVIKICSSSYNCNLSLLNWYLLRVELQQAPPSIL